MNALSKWFGILLFLVFPAMVFAETISFKSGKTIEARVLEKTNEAIKIDISGISVTYYLDEIESINSENPLVYEFTADSAVDAVSSKQREAKNIERQKDSRYTKQTKAKKHQNVYWLYNEKGLADLDNHSYQSAAREFEAAIQLLPQESVAYINLGIAYKKLGRQEEAIRSLEKAISLDPEDSEIYYNLGNVYLDLARNNEEAAQCYLKAIQKDENNAKAYLNLGLAYYRLGSFAKARENLEKAKKLSYERNDDWGVYFAEENLKTIP